VGKSMEPVGLDIGVSRFGFRGNLVELTLLEIYGGLMDIYFTVIRIRIIRIMGIIVIRAHARNVSYAREARFV
jgi:hypothetical protein